MKSKIVHSVLIAGALLVVTASADRCLARSDKGAVAAPKSVSKNVGRTKHIHWRHRGGKHPHYGSRRLNTETRAR